METTRSLVFVYMLTICLCLSTSSEVKPLTGLAILKNQLNVKRIRAHFSFKEKKVYYMVRFCGKKIPTFCFVTDMEDEGTNGETIDVVRNINLWMKLISTLNGKNNYNIDPVSQQGSSEQEHHKNCHQGNYFRITKGPSKEIVKQIMEEGKNRPACLKRKNPSRNCQRVCLKGESDQCDEIRLHCYFDGCKCYRRINLHELRKQKSSKKQKTTSTLS